MKIMCLNNIKTKPLTAIILTSLALLIPGISSAGSCSNSPIIIKNNSATWIKVDFAAKDGDIQVTDECGKSSKRLEDKKIMPNETKTFYACTGSNSRGNATGEIKISPPDTVEKPVDEASLEKIKYLFKRPHFYPGSSQCEASNSSIHKSSGTLKVSVDSNSTTNDKERKASITIEVK